MANIHPTAQVSPQAHVADDVDIGPFCVVEPKAVIGKACILQPHVTIKGNVVMGDNNKVCQGAILGGDPQDRKYQGEETFLEIGDDNFFGEYVTIHRATGAGNKTVIGDRNYIMAFVHMGHNGTITDDCTITNNVALAGHVTIEERATIGGMTGVHQFVRIGKFAMVGGMSRITRDCPPFLITEGMEQTVWDINAIGLRRIGIKPEARLALHKACKLIFKSKLALSNAIEIVRREVPQTDEVDYLIAFMERLYHGKNGRGDQR
ncbi:MAG: acyl-ACP--UDP-N-acetylglucosamine O-acyltransferase [Armatimonadetes bacterium]|nr:acyl-ACP--UDP-N-acetylglucosamine O-acyltransferase [Armatimonadota bacterium]MBS1710785.1 acyl-ACP--UDP-N-acetylglucosamine O-acyltransferase [Armatimonadota bacterium]MBX3108457.1 acyl-ACP--UDP-N-acetylglucosamine O-acyltransferase [Fimbriimonadaceae bacterium]